MRTHAARTPSLAAPVAAARAPRANPAVRSILRSATIQPKLKIGAVDDPAEREADRVADQVMRMAEPDLAAGNARALSIEANGDGASPRFVRRKCAACGAEHDHDTGFLPLSIRISSAGTGIPRMCADCEDGLRRKESDAMGFAGGPVAPATESALGSLGSGTPLPASERAFFEPRFGRTFEKVRVHTGGNADGVAGAINARAFTLGENIAFAGNEYRPGTSAGRRLIAHELTHVVQQAPTFRSGQAIRTHRSEIRREPVTAVTITAVVGKCIIGAIIGALLDAAIQAALYAYRHGTWRFWEASLNYCSIFLSAVIGCIAAPISAFALDAWITARLGAMGGLIGTLLGRIVLFITQKLAIMIPKTVVGKLLKLGCISEEQSTALGVTPEEAAAMT